MGTPKNTRFPRFLSWLIKSTLKRAKAPLARGEPSGGCCSRGSFDADGAHDVAAHRCWWPNTCSTRARTLERVLFIARGGDLHRALRAASRNNQIVMASGTGPSSSRSRKRVNDGRSRIRYRIIQWPSAGMRANLQPGHRVPGTTTDSPTRPELGPAYPPKFAEKRVRERDT